MRDEEIREAGIPYTSLKADSTRDFRRFAAFVRLLRDEQIDIVHAHLWDANLWATVAGRLARTPVVLAHEHTWAFEGNRVRVASDRFVISRLASMMACVSEDDRRKMVEIEQIPAERIRVLPNSIRRSPP